MAISDRMTDSMSYDDVTMTMSSANLVCMYGRSMYVRYVALPYIYHRLKHIGCKKRFVGVSGGWK